MVGRTKIDVVDLVEVPLVEQEPVEQLVLARELDRDVGPADVELPGDDEADRHHHGRQDADHERHVVHVLEHVLLLANFSDSRKNSSTPWPANSSLNGKPAQDRAGRQHAERDQHHQRALVRRLVSACGRAARRGRS